MSISITKRNYLCQVTILALLIGGVGGVLFFSLYPQAYFGGYPFIPVYYWLFGVFSINCTEMCRRVAPDKLFMAYMGIRVLRMILSILVMVVYGVVVQSHVRAFLLTFMAHYLLFLIYDSWFFFTFELNKKLQKKNRQTENKLSSNS